MMTELIFFWVICPFISKLYVLSNIVCLFRSYRVFFFVFWIPVLLDCGYQTCKVAAKYYLHVDSLELH